MKVSLFVLLLVVILVLTGCGSSRMNQDQNKGNDTLATTEGALDQNPIAEKYWKLVTLEGRKVSMSPNRERETYFMLKTDQNRVTGFAGCNTFNGTYTLEKGRRIRFSPLASTRKDCPDVNVNESERTLAGF